MAILDGDLLVLAAELQYLQRRAADVMARLYLANLPDSDGYPIREAITRGRVQLSVASSRLVRVARNGQEEVDERAAAEPCAVEVVR